MSSSNLVRIALAEESTYGVIPTAVKASLVVGDITYEALKAGAYGNEISIEYLDTVTAGSEVVTVTGNKISVEIEDGVSSATQVKAAIDASAAALLLVTATITGIAGDPQSALAEDFLENGAGEFKQARFTSESLSGTPETTESQQIRTDRMSSGQVVTGLTVGGGMPFELAKEEVIELLMASALYSDWNTVAAVVATLAIDISAGTITRSAGNWTSDGIVKGDFITLSGFASSGNNVTVQVVSVDSATVIKYVGPSGMSTEGGGTGYRRLDKLSIGTTKKSFSMEKAFTDLTNKAINYRGMIVSEMTLNVAFGELITGSFNFLGNAYAAVSAAADFNTYDRDIEDPATTNTMNGSVDMPFLTSGVGGTLTDEDFCIQSLALNLSNNLNSQVCIGNIAPEDYTPGQCSIGVSLSTYLKDGSWGLLAKKLSQEAFALGFMIQNSGGLYGFYLPAIQVSFDDPASGGQNQDVTLEMEGQAKVGDSGESAISIFRIPTA